MYNIDYKRFLNLGIYWIMNFGHEIAPCGTPITIETGMVSLLICSCIELRRRTNCKLLEEFIESTERCRNYLQAK